MTGKIPSHSFSKVNRKFKEYQLYDSIKFKRSKLTENNPVMIRSILKIGLIWAPLNSKQFFWKLLAWVDHKFSNNFRILILWILQILWYMEFPASLHWSYWNFLIATIAAIRIYMPGKTLWQADLWALELQLYRLCLRWSLWFSCLKLFTLPSIL